jgi:hypothetical protein
MTRRSATPVRFESEVADRLVSFVGAHPGLSLSAAANLLVDEGLRMSEYPGIVFRSGPSGRRAGLSGGPDVWEAVRAVKSARQNEPDLSEKEIFSLVENNTGVPGSLLRIALNYWAAHSDEVDAEIDAADQAEATADVLWRREHDLLNH